VIGALKSRRAAWVVGTSLALLALLLLYIVVNLWQVRQAYAREIDTIYPRLARLQGIMQVREELQVAAGRVAGDVEDAVYGPQSGDTATTAAAMQQQIRDVMSSAGMSVTGSQVLPVRQVDGLLHLELRLSAAGNTDALDAAITALRLVRPLVIVQAISIQPERDRRGRGEQMPREDPRRVVVEMRLLSLKLPA